MTTEVRGSSCTSDLAIATIIFTRPFHNGSAVWVTSIVSNHAACVIVWTTKLYEHKYCPMYFQDIWTSTSSLNVVNVFALPQTLPSNLGVTIIVG
jgi:hypothetical protein